jgi:hypothetical protein
VKLVLLGLALAAINSLGDFILFYFVYFDTTTPLVFVRGLNDLERDIVCWRVETEFL